jgi:hypothetical protein
MALATRTGSFRVPIRRGLKNDQIFSMFNGRLDNDAVGVNPVAW